jgi:hypothetical protein
MQKRLLKIVAIAAIVCFLTLLVFLSALDMCFATNPITSVTNDGVILTRSGTGYETTYAFNPGIISADGTIWVTYNASTGDMAQKVFFSSLPVSSYPATMTKSGVMVPLPTGYHSRPYSTTPYYLDGLAESNLLYDPITGKYHIYTNTALCTDTNCYTYDVRIGHLINTVMGTTGWTWANPNAVPTSLYSSWGGAQSDSYGTYPLSGGGYIIYLSTSGVSSNGDGTYTFGPEKNGYVTATSLDLDDWGHATELTDVEAVTGTASAEQPQQFVYGANYFLIVTGAHTYILSSSSQTSGWLRAATNSEMDAMFGVPWDSGAIGYITGYLGGSLNSGSLLAVGNRNARSTSDEIMSYTLHATPLTGTAPTLSNVEGTLSSGTLTITGTVTPGLTDLWEVGYVSSAGTRAQCPWGTWSGSPGKVANSFTCTLSATTADTVTVTAYNVALESASTVAQTGTGTPPEPPVAGAGFAPVKIGTGFSKIKTGTGFAPVMRIQ